MVNGIPTSQSIMKLEVRAVDNDIFIGEGVSEIELHRGTASVLKLNLYINNECCDKPVHLCQFWGDGILIATPLGSLGRAMTLHGPLMHK